MTLAHRRVHPPALPAPSIVDVLLSGWSGRPPDDGEADFDVFLLSTSELAEAWRVHRAALLIEAERRGINEPWGLQFDA